MSRGKPNKRYTPEFKKLVVETMMKEKLGGSVKIYAQNYLQAPAE